MSQLVLSLDNPRNPKAARMSPAQAVLVLNGLVTLYGWKMQNVRGCYRGDKEAALHIDTPDVMLSDHRLTVILDLLAACGQETLLYISSRGRVSLLNCDSQRCGYTDLGFWIPVPDGVEPEGWTEFDDGSRYTTTKV